MTLVQPIVVSKTGSHEQVICAVGLAATVCWKDSRDNPCWKPWFKDSFTKTVRRGTEAQFNACKSLPGAHWLKFGGAYALACQPFEDTPHLPPPLNKMQVSGLDRERQGWVLQPKKGRICFAINPELNMSTGKTAAQVAHAMIKLCLIFEFDWMNNFCVNDSQDLFDFAKNPHHNIIEIHDAGRTEIESGSLTVAVAEFQ